MNQPFCEIIAKEIRSIYKKNIPKLAKEVKVKVLNSEDGKPDGNFILIASPIVIVSLTTPNGVHDFFENFV